MSTDDQAPIARAVSALAGAQEEAERRVDQLVTELASKSRTLLHQAAVLPELQRTMSERTAVGIVLERLDPDGVMRGVPSVLGVYAMRRELVGEDRSDWDRYTVLAHAVVVASKYVHDAAAGLTAINTVRRALVGIGEH